MIRKMVTVVLIFAAAGTAALGVLSFWETPYYTVVLGPREDGSRWPLELSIYRGGMYIKHYEYSGIGRSPKQGWRWYAVLDETTPDRRMWRIDHRLRRPLPPNYYTHLRIPLWPWLVLFLGYPVGPLVVRFLRRQPKQGWCVRCGYDLTGNESGVCPECGSEITA